MQKIIFVLVFVAHSAFANWTELSEAEFVLADPPAAGSAEEKREFDDLLAAQKSRTRQDCLEGNLQTLPTFTPLFGPTAGILSAAEYEAARPVVRKVIALTQKIADVFKERYRRLRPYQTLKNLVPCLIHPGWNNSYPSGHAASGTVAACVLAKKFPHLAQNLVDHGRRIGQLRFLGGVHHPSDIAAGEDLALQICDRLLSDSEFVKELGIETL